MLRATFKDVYSGDFLLAMEWTTGSRLDIRKHKDIKANCLYLLQHYSDCLWVKVEQDGEPVLFYFFSKVGRVIHAEMVDAHKGLDHKHYIRHYYQDRVFDDQRAQLVYIEKLYA